MDLQRALRSIVAHLTRRTLFHGLYEYRVVQEEIRPGDIPGSAQLVLQIVSKIDGLDDAPRLDRVHGGAAIGEQCRPGSLVLVGFIGGDPARPFVAHYQPSLPIRAYVDAEGELRVGASLLPAGQITLGSQPLSAVALGPQTAQALNAIVAWSAAVSTFATAVGGAVPALSGAATTLVAAQQAMVATITPLLGSAPSGLVATQVSAS